MLVAFFHPKDTGGVLLEIVQSKWFANSTRVVNPLPLLENVDEVLHHTLAEVLSTEMSITARGHNLEDTVAESDKVNDAPEWGAGPPISKFRTPQRNVASLKVSFN